MYYCYAACAGLWVMPTSSSRSSSSGGGVERTLLRARALRPRCADAPTLAAARLLLLHSLPQAAGIAFQKRTQQQLLVLMPPVFICEAAAEVSRWACSLLLRLVHTSAETILTHSSCLLCGCFVDNNVLGRCYFHLQMQTIDAVI